MTVSRLFALVALLGLAASAPASEVIHSEDFNASGGDTVEVQFRGGWDWLAYPTTPPNWAVDNVVLNLTPEPTTLLVWSLLAGLGGEPGMA